MLMRLVLKHALCTRAVLQHAAAGAFAVFLAGCGAAAAVGAAPRA